MRGSAVNMFAGQVAMDFIQRRRKAIREEGKAAALASQFAPASGDAIFTSAHYPRSWSEYVGQEDAKAHLRDAITSARRRDARLDHILLASGIPGIGKTSLAMLVGKEWGQQFLMLSGTLTVKDAYAALVSLDDHDILFIDEVHRLVHGGKGKAEWLLNYLQDGALFGAGGVTLDDVPDVTVIGATTDAGRLPETILDRFLIRPALHPYDEVEALSICVQLAARVGFGTDGVPLPTDPDFYYTISTAANRVPRLMIPVLIAVRDIYVARDGDNWDGTTFDLDVPLRRAGLYPDGLTDQAAHYLLTLRDLGGTAGEKAIANQMREPGGLAYVEQLLVDRRFITRTANGRSLTQLGQARIQQLADARHGKALS